jgi:hypothetical protein
MDKSNSTNIPTVEQLVNQAVTYLKEWTSKELDNIIARSILDRKPVIMRLNRGYIVGNYFINQHNHRWWKISHRYSNDEHIFTSKLSAICYAFYYQIGSFKFADRVLKEDDEVGRLTVKTEQYRYRFDEAKKKKNTHKIDLFLVRFEEASLRLTFSKNLLEKTLRSAKYIKF